MLSGKVSVRGANLAVDHAAGDANEEGGSKGRILFVGLEGSEAAALVAMLRGKGFEAAAASDAEKALEQVARSAPQLILANACMPGTDGARFTKQVRDARPGTRVILVAGAPTVEEAVRALRCGAEDYVEELTINCTE